MGRCTRMNKEYLVIWEIDVTASSPRMAALTARAIQQDPDNLATYYVVKDRKEAKTYHVELHAMAEPEAD